MFNHQITLAALLALGASAMPSASFAADSGPGLYTGASVGVRTAYGLDCVSAAPCDVRTSKSGKIYAGYNLESHQFGGLPTVTSVEFMAYAADPAKAGFHTPGGFVQGSGKFNGVGVSLMSESKFNDFSFITRAGLGHSNGSVNYAGGGSDSKGSYGLLLGLGLAYALDKNWSLHADWDRIPSVNFSASQSSNVNMLSLGASYHF